MGRPPDCGCCGTVPPDIGPSSVCAYTTGYFNRPWDEQNIAGCNYTKYNAYENGFFPSGEVIRLNWLSPSSIFANWQSLPWCSGSYSENDCYCNWYCDRSWWDNNPEYEDLISIPIPIGCANRSFDWGFKIKHLYSLILTKEAYFASGITIFGIIKSLSNFIEAKILINDGSEKVLVSEYDIGNEFFDGRPSSSCNFPMFATGSYITRNSGCFKITVSGSSQLANSSNYKIAPSGFIDFVIIPSSNVLQANINNFYITSNACGGYYNPYNDTNWEESRYCYSNCTAWGCCQFCDDCNSMFCSDQGGTRNWWWNGFYELNKFLNLCSGSVENPQCGIPDGQGYKGAGWKMTSASCGNNQCNCADYGACCLPNNDCVETDCKACEQASGIWQGKGTSCYGQNALNCAFVPQ